MTLTTEGADVCMVSLQWQPWLVSYTTSSSPFLMKFDMSGGMNISFLPVSHTHSVLSLPRTSATKWIYLFVRYLALATLMWVSNYYVFSSLPYHDLQSTSVCWHRTWRAARCHRSFDMSGVVHLSGSHPPGDASWCTLDSCSTRSARTCIYL